jgi:PKD repeat protein
MYTALGEYKIKVTATNKSGSKTEITTIKLLIKIEMLV